jgi:hypothetical protein
VGGDEWWIVNRGGKRRVLLQKLTVANQEIFLALWNLKSDDRVHKSRPLVRILSAINPVHTVPPYVLRSNVILSSYGRSRFESGLISSHFIIKILYAFFFPMHATQPSYFTVLDLIFLIILSGKQRHANYKALYYVVLSRLLLVCLTTYYMIILSKHTMQVPITVAAQSKAWTFFGRSNTRVLVSNPTRGMDVCVHLFCVCVVLCVRNGLATGWSPVQGVQPTVCRLRSWKSGQDPQGL